jgi:hypothetical protein
MLLEKTGNMRRSFKKKRGQSTFEITSLLICILAAFIVFQKYIARGIVGRWKNIGDSMGQGRLFDPNRSVRCAANKWFQDKPGENIWPDAVWYDQTCFEEQCHGHCLYATKDSRACRDCCERCWDEECEPL